MREHQRWSDTHPFVGDPQTLDLDQIHRLRPVQMMIVGAGVAT
jgi:hypothetical protein